MTTNNVPSDADLRRLVQEQYNGDPVEFARVVLACFGQPTMPVDAIRAGSYGGVYVWIGDVSNCQRVTEQQIDNELVSGQGLASAAHIATRAVIEHHARRRIEGES